MSKEKKHVNKWRLLFIIIRRSGAGGILAGFLGLYLACALVTLVVEPDVTTIVDALWFMWAVSTTVGLGDLTAVTIVGRTASMICSVAAIVTTAIITAVVVDYFNESRQNQMDESVSLFLDKLEHLPELDESELEEISARVRKMRS